MEIFQFLFYFNDFFSAIYAPNYQVPCRNKETNSTDDHLNPGHVYAPLNNTGVYTIYGRGNTLEAVYRDPALDTGKKSKHHGPIRVEQAVYNFMEDLSIPVHNVVDERYLEASKGPSHYGPMYPDNKTLEQPSPDDAKEHDDSEYTNVPVYNVHEEKPNPGVSTEDEGYGTRNSQDLDPVFNVL